MSNECNRPSRQFMHLVGAYAQIHFRMNGLISSPNHPPAGSRYDRETKRETEDGSSRVKKGGIASRKAMSKKILHSSPPGFLHPPGCVLTDYWQWLFRAAWKALKENIGGQTLQISGDFPRSEKRKLGGPQTYGEAAKAILCSAAKGGLCFQPTPDLCGCPRGTEPI
jgi:hypothetical protein